MATSFTSDAVGSGSMVNYAQQQGDLAQEKSALADRMLGSGPFSVAMGSLRSLLPVADPRMRDLRAEQQLAQGAGGLNDGADSEDDDDEGDE